MAIKVVLFDLDGTLLPLEQDYFIKCYFMAISKRLARHGYEPQKFISSLWQGVKAMVLNDGKSTNEEAFWNVFKEIYGENVRDDEPYFEAFYLENFDELKNLCGFNAKAKQTVDKIKSKGLRVALATNPVFPRIATQKRISWAGLDYTDFELCTTYENSKYSKPNLNYYKEILTKLNVKAEECLMIGNDVSDDMVVKNLNMKVFLLTDCLINTNNEDISVYPNCNFDDLIYYIDSL